MTSDAPTPEPSPTASRSLGNLAGALGIHLLLLPLFLFVLAYAIADSGGTDADFVVGAPFVVGAWLILAGLVVRWWIRGRQELWNVTLAWATICWLNMWLLPLLFWPRFRHWLGGSLKPWRKPSHQPAL